MENKDRLIDKLDLTDEQKEQLKAYFKKYPTSEAKIDWNNKNLQWKDFESLLTNAGKSKSQAKKKGLSGLKAGRDYVLVGEEDGQWGRYTLYYPLTFLGSETLANPKVSPIGVTGQWCISGGNYGPDNDDKYWRRYIEDNGFDFIFLFTDKHKFAIARKAGWVTRYSWSDDFTFQIFNQTDNEIDRVSLAKAILEDSDIGPDSELLKSMSYHQACKEVWGYLDVQYLQNVELKKHLFVEEIRQCGEAKAALKTSADGKTLYKFNIMTKGNEKVILPEEIEIIKPGAIIGLDANLYINSKHPLTFIDPEKAEDSEMGTFGQFDGVIHSNQAPDYMFYRAGFSQVSSDIKCMIQLSPEIRSIGDQTFSKCRPSNAGPVTVYSSWSQGPYNMKAYRFEDLFEKKQIPETLTKVGYGAFWGSNICEFPFEKYPKCSYGGYAFCGTQIQKAILPEGITVLPHNMFAWCCNLQELYLPVSLQRISEQALFDTHPDLKIYYAGSEKDWAKIDIARGWLGYTQIRDKKGIEVIFNNPEGKVSRFFKSGQIMPEETIEEPEPYNDNKTGYTGW